MLEIIDDLNLGSGVALTMRSERNAHQVLRDIEWLKQTNPNNTVKHQALLKELNGIVEVLINEFGREKFHSMDSQYNENAVVIENSHKVTLQ